MTVDTGYISLAVMKGAANLEAADGAFDAFLNLARLAGSRAVDSYCKTRFYADTAVSDRVFTPMMGDEVIVDDFFTTTGLVVKTDTAGDGSFATTWTIGTDFAVEPANGIEDGIEGVAMMRLVAAGSKAFVVGRQRLKISTKWGWAATPDPVAQASAVVASALFKLKDAPLGQDWNDESSPIAVATNPKLRELLDDTPYSRRRR